MNNAVGEILPLALGVAVSPMAVVALLLVLRGPRAGVAAPAYVLGWAVGVAAAVTVFTIAGSLLPDEGSRGSRPIGGSIRIILGGLLALLAARTWTLRPRTGAEPRPPAWMAVVDALSPARAGGLAALLAVVTPKNLLLAADVGLAADGGTVEQRVIYVMLFTLIASLPLGALAYMFRPRAWDAGRGVPETAGNAEAGDVWESAEAALAAEEREKQMRARLERARRWLLQHDAGIMTVLLAVLAFNLVGAGIAAF